MPFFRSGNASDAGMKSCLNASRKDLRKNIEVHLLKLDVWRDKPE